MLEITIPGGEFWDNRKEEFITTKETTLHLEHSLISLTKWEQKYKRRFLSDGPKNVEENLFYIKCMSLDRNVSDLVIRNISQESFEKIIEYIKDPMTATTLPPDPPSKKNKMRKEEPLSSELIYYYMTALNIPFSCEKWHLNNLLTLIKIANIKNAPEDQKKRSSQEIMKDYSALNKARRAALHSKG